LIGAEVVCVVFIKKKPCCFASGVNSYMLSFFLKLYHKSSVDIDSGLGVVPTAAAAVHKPTGLCATIIRILGIEDIIDLA
jgi:tRNA1(Val) A37 N6-methylase TrmN6